MHRDVLNLCHDLAADLREGRQAFTMTAGQVRLLLRGLATAERLRGEAHAKWRRYGEDRVLNYFLHRLPARQTKHDNMPLCCMATVRQIIGEVRTKQAWDGRP